MTPTRRDLLKTGAAVAALSSVPAFAKAEAATPEPSLNAIAAGKGMRFGSAFAWSPPGADAGSFANPAYARLLTGECGVLVPENEMKWQFIRPSADRFDFARFDAMMAWAGAHELPVRGHNLLWHRTKWFPKWLNAYDYGAQPAKEAERLLVTHIDTVIGRYGDRITDWDVVNETVNEFDGTMEQTSLSKALGSSEAVVDLAFHTARAKAPSARLVYNDFMSWEPGMEKHCDGVLRLLEGMKARGTPVDALGVQSHIITQGLDTTGSVLKMQERWRRFLDQVVGMGLGLLITEFDVRDNNLPADPVVRDRAVGDYTRAYLDVMFAYPQVKDVLAWGMCDRYTWIEGYQPRPDHAKRRPCPYDDRFRAKPMRAGIAGAFAAAVKR